MSLSLAEELALLPIGEAELIIKAMDEDIINSWDFWARPEQLRPAEILSGAMLYWLCLCGRGWGKTHVGAKTVEDWAREEPGIRIGIMGQTHTDVRDVMVEGPSGILSQCRDDFMPEFRPGLGKLYWPNGSVGLLYSAEQPRSMRGPQHHKLWLDEFCAWEKPQEAWDMAMFGLRLGSMPQAIITTTPRPIPSLREIISDPLTYVTRGSTNENRGNLAESFISKIITKYEGTRLGRQELEAEMLDDHPGALWSYTLIEGCRVAQHPAYVKKVVAIDPAISSNPHSDETGITVCGRCEKKRGYVLDDLSGIYKPAEWATKAIDAYHKWGCNKIVAESNQGGEMVANTIHAIDDRIPVTLVHASEGKYARAEPISMFYEQGRAHHVGHFAKLEDQMATYDPSEPEWRRKSPDRLDSLVWGMTELMIGTGRKRIRVS